MFPDDVLLPVAALRQGLNGLIYLIHTYTIHVLIMIEQKYLVYKCWYCFFLLFVIGMGDFDLDSSMRKTMDE